MKKVLFVLAFGFLAATSHASYLFWQVSPSDSDTIASSTAWAGGYDNATVWVVNNSTKEKEALGDGENDYVATFNGKTGLISVDVSSFSGGDGSAYSFYVELASSTYSPGSMTSVATTSAQTYADLQTAGSIQATSTLSDVPQATVWHGGSGGYSAAPEPTSAMLMLLGVAGLALRRKQRKLA